MRLVEPPAKSIDGNFREEIEGFTFLVEEKRPRFSIEMCERFASEGASCLIVSRDPPSQHIGGSLGEVKRAIWLTNLVGKDRMNPTAIGILMGEIKKFIEHSENRPVVLLDGLEYLISINTYDRMLQFIHQLRDIIVMAGAVLIIPIDTRTLSDRELALLERNLQTVIPSSDGESSENLVNLHSGEVAGISHR